MLNNSQELKEIIKAEAYNLGFCVIGFSLPTPLEQNHYKKWLRNNFHAGMKYLADENTIANRSDVRNIFPSCKSIISLGAIFENPAQRERINIPVFSGKIARYATGKDYHQILANKIDLLMEKISISSDTEVAWISAVDTKPVSEREIASLSGLGWIAKNGMLTNPEFGSAMFLCEILLDIELPPDSPFEKDYCGICTKCIDACPTQCIQDDRTIDSNKCISYLTIENRGVIPEEYFDTLNESIFGCDICLQVCPWNQKAKSTPIMPEFVSDPQMAEFDIPENIDKIISSFHRNYEHSAIRRAGKQGFLRNCMIRLAQNPTHENIQIIDEIASAMPDTYLINQREIIDNYWDTKKGS